MYTRQQHVADLRATAATYARTGSPEMAAKKNALADKYEAMSDEEYNQEQLRREAMTTTGMREAAARMAARITR